MKIAYGKLGRSIPLTVDSCGEVGGDIEVVNLMNRLVAEGHEVHLVGRNRADVEVPGVVNHWAKGGLFYATPVPTRNIDDPEYVAFLQYLETQTPKLPKFDAWVLWLGQHGSSLHCVPAVAEGMAGQYTEPLISLINYGYPVVHMVNKLGVRPIWLCPDPRNMIKMRDLWDPNQRTVLAQYQVKKNNTFFSEIDDTLRSGFTTYNYSGIEMLAVNPEDLIEEVTPEQFNQRRKFGILVNEGPTGGKSPRLGLVEKWLKPLPLEPDSIAGTWTVNSAAKLGIIIRAIPNQQVNKWLRQFATTITFPASSSGWATAKPWECFASGVLCFKHPEYDDQNHIYSKTHMPQELRQFLSPYSSSEFRERVNTLNPELWARFANLQRQYFIDSYSRLEGGYGAIRAAIESF